MPGFGKIKDPRYAKDIYHRAGQWSPSDLSAFAELLLSHFGTRVTFEDQKNCAAVDNVYPSLAFSSITTSPVAKWSAYARTTGVAGGPVMGVSIWSCGDVSVDPTHHSSDPYFNDFDGAVQVQFDPPRKFVSVWARPQLLFYPPSQHPQNKPFLWAYDQAGHFLDQRLYAPDYGTPGTAWGEWQTLALYIPSGISSVLMSCQTGQPGDPVRTIFTNFYLSDD
jgi:hypothetical protein